MTYYKALNADGTSYWGGSGTWNLPTADAPGEWMPTIKQFLTCKSGYHGCRREDLVRWLGPAIYVMEYDGEPTIAGDKVVGSRARLLRHIDTWNERTARLYACDCAERVVGLTGPDPCCVETIAVARRFAVGEATLEELRAARDAAWTAIEGYARTAARDAAWTAAGDAAAECYVWIATLAAAKAAAGTAADWAAAEAVDWAAARDAAQVAERAWQTDRLFDYLEGRA